ncbi:MAG: nitroreductase family protein [Candidatus Pacearchaeota archaeon]
MYFDELLKERKCVRHYSSKPVRFDEIVAICEAARFSPMAGNIYTIKLIIVSDKETKAKLAEAALGQEFIKDAPYVLVVCSDLTNLTRSYGERGERVYSRQQAGAVIENMFLKAVELGVATCWVGAFEEKAVRRILKIPDKVQVEVILPIGIPAGKTATKKKPELKQIIYFEKWGQGTAKPVKRVPA